MVALVALTKDGENDTGRCSVNVSDVAFACLQFITDCVVNST